MSGIKIYKEIHLEDLPRWGAHGKAKEGGINWKASIGYKVRFVYGDIEGKVEIISHEGEFSYIKYKNKKPFKISNSHFKHCCLGELLGKYTHKFKIEIGTSFKSEKRDMIVTARKYRKDEKGQYYKYYNYNCNKCGDTTGWIDESNLLKGIGCGACCPAPKNIGIKNSIVTTAPWMILYFQNGYQDAIQYTKCSSKKLYFKCPDCGRIKDKPISISNIYYKHSIACSCGDGQTYPFKFMFSVLEQLNVEFETEYSP